MYSVVKSASIVGMDVCFVDVEIDVSDGLPSFQMVGSLSNKTKESKERVTVALRNVGVELPPSHITVNVSPADVRKDATSLDVAIAVGLLEDLEVIRPSKKKILFLGELGLLGELKPVSGVLPIIKAAAKEGFDEVILPKTNAKEGALIPGINIRGAELLSEIIGFLLAGESEYDNMIPKTIVDANDILASERKRNLLDFVDVKGQTLAKRAALISAAGFHNLLLVGPPGAGKSMIAKRLPGIMPPLTLEESLEVTSVYSVAGKLPPGDALISERPFQAPHHSASGASLSGGGSIPRPGQISLAHRGVLFLDELPEFPRNVIDSLRGPIEDKYVHVSRVNGDVIFPSDFILVAAMNPCPCGYYPDHSRCKCPETKIRGYMGKISGPILDRIDLCVEMGGVSADTLMIKADTFSSASMRKLVERARIMQAERFEGSGNRFNSDIGPSDFSKYCKLDSDGEKYMDQVYRKFKLSVRSYHRIIRVARTVADLKGDNFIKREHLAEAVGFRPNRDFWM